jgi:hypothetical protein
VVLLKFHYGISVVAGPVGGTGAVVASAESVGSGVGVGSDAGSVAFVDSLD